VYKRWVDFAVKYKTSFQHHFVQDTSNAEDMAGRLLWYLKKKVSQFDGRKTLACKIMFFFIKKTPPSLLFLSLRPLIKRSIKSFKIKNTERYNYTHVSAMIEEETVRLHCCC